MFAVAEKHSILKENGKTDPQKLKTLESEKKDELVKDFEQNYGVTHRPGEMPETSPMFRHLNDIPWQSSILRAIDIIDYHGEDPPPRVADLTCNTPLGRELFEIALEFFLRDTEDPFARLTSTLHLIEDLVLEHGESNDKSVKNVVKDLGNWVKVNSPKPLDPRTLAPQTLKSLRDKLEKAKLEPESFETLKQRVVNIPVDTILGAFGQIKENRDPLGERLLARVAGYKLQELLKVINQNLDHLHNQVRIQQKMKRDLRILESYLSIRTSGEWDAQAAPQPCQVHKNRFYQTILSSLGVCNIPVNRLQDCTWQAPSPRPLEMYILNRISISGAYASLNDKMGYAEERNTLKYSQLALKKRDPYPPQFPSCKVVGDRIIHTFNVLGRYDILSMMATRPLCRCPFPFFQSDSQETQPQVEELINERFPNFFTRREMALPVRLIKEEDWNSGIFSQDKESKLIALVVVTLQRRSYRLDFLYRLLRVIKPDSPEDPNSPPEAESLLDLNAHIGKKDCAFLTDGWGDLILMCFGKPEERLKKIFELQGLIYEDFMVDRTELILTPSCVNVAACEIQRAVKDEREPQFDIICQLRFMEDRLLRRSNHEFELEINNKIKKQKFEKRTGFTYDRVSRIPGRMDYRLHFEPVSTEPASSDEFIKHLFDLLDYKYLDRVDTSVELRVDRNLA